MSENKGNTHPIRISWTSPRWLRNKLSHWLGNDDRTSHIYEPRYSPQFWALVRWNRNDSRELGLFQKTFGDEGVDSEERGGGDTALERGDEGDEENEEEREQEEASIRVTAQLRPGDITLQSSQVRKLRKFAKFATLTLIN
ncbi:hypothetical protein PPACK8108_LOCUS3292 [Phakopsora pachyrhizi]|uniref:Uncharacterized protein n=1 Tax=Phakopsora pachyrhizi TaxID=170000 RepID=A0AAV0AJQ7_PHAPC|nr:hypothetical protein PPACK8108_LOCUS3292 [Phakopsora pachyrhizi]